MSEEKKEKEIKKSVTERTNVGRGGEERRALLGLENNALHYIALHYIALPRRTSKYMALGGYLGGSSA